MLSEELGWHRSLGDRINTTSASEAGAASRQAASSTCFPSCDTASLCDLQVPRGRHAARRVGTWSRETRSRFR